MYTGTAHMSICINFVIHVLYSPQQHGQTTYYSCYIEIRCHGERDSLVGTFGSHGYCHQEW